MNVQTIEFDASTPIQKQITVPTNSDFAVGIKVYRDGEVVDVKRHELSVNGQIASNQRNGYNIFELSSDSNVGMKQFDVEAAKLPVIDTTLTQSNRFKNSSSVIPHKKLYPGGDSLSVFGIDREIELSCTDLTVQFIDYGSTVAIHGAKYSIGLSGPTTGYVGQYIFAEIPLSDTSLSDDFWKNDYVGKFWLGDDEHTIVDSVKVDQYTSITNGAGVRRNQTLCCDGIISMKYGYQYKFPLQISQIDTGYIEKNKVAPFVYTSTATTVAANELLEKYKGKPVTNVNMPDLETIEINGMKDAFKDCKQLTTVDFSKLSAVGTDGLDGTFDGCIALEIVLFQSSEAIPTITSTTFANTNDTFKVIVPDALYEDWIVAENWSDLSSHITQVSAYAAVMTPYGGQDDMDENN